MNMAECDKGSVSKTSLGSSIFCTDLLSNWATGLIEELKKQVAEAYISKSKQVFKKYNKYFSINKVKACWYILIGNLIEHHVY